MHTIWPKFFALSGSFILIFACSSEKIIAQNPLTVDTLYSETIKNKRKALKDERKSWGFDNWKNEFKERALCLCLLEGYDNGEVREFILTNDRSYYNAIGIAIFDPTLKPIIQQEVERMKKDSIASLSSVGEAAAGKRVFDHCLNFYTSKGLDSIAKKEIPKWKKIKNIMAVILTFIPSN